jgi:hypothetical protein
MDRSEIDAIRQILAGDRDEYRVLMDRYFQPVFRIAFRITGDETDAEEATQEAFLRAYNKLFYVSAECQLFDLDYENCYEYFVQSRGAPQSRSCP